MRSLREPKALTIQPMRCRSDQNIAEILSKHPQQNSFQVVHFTSARRFDDGQVRSCFYSPPAPLLTSFAAATANQRALPQRYRAAFGGEKLFSP